jgi:hypothetical protein
MSESQRYRDNAADCLSAAQETRAPFKRKIRLSMAVSWLSLARHVEETEEKLASTPSSKEQ